MNFDDYQAAAKLTAVYPDYARVYYPALGLCGEAGEVANKVKKVFRDDNGQVSDEKRAALKGEIGDVLWYVAGLASDLSLSLNECAEENIAKLNSRKERGVLQGSGDNR
jgi:NTP pyrophosphatase (non-canonical NTP hydrolase)